MKGSLNNKLINLRNYVDGEADTLYEYFMLLVIVVNTVSLGLETSKSISANFGNILFWIDQICLFIFIAELLFVCYTALVFGVF